MKADKSVRISAQIDPRTKEIAEKALSDIGLDISTAIATFLKQVAFDQRMPFTPDAIASLDRATDLAIADVKAGRIKTFNSLGDFRKDLYLDDAERG